MRDLGFFVLGALLTFVLMVAGLVMLAWSELQLRWHRRLPPDPVSPEETARIISEHRDELS